MKARIVEWNATRSLNLYTIHISPYSHRILHVEMSCNGIHKCINRSCYCCHQGEPDL
jgi:hypothetical protein